MSQNKVIIANWKMNPQSLSLSEGIFDGILKLTKKSRGVDIIVCPPFPFLSIIKKSKSKNIYLGAQDVFEEPSGSYTGEISAKMLTSLKVKYVIIGHSERRKLGETNQIINKKIINALKSKLLPILCVGETSRDNNGFYLATVKQQLVECLDQVPKNKMKNIIIAYEPVWAIGSFAKREATKEEFIEMQIFIKKIISDLYGLNVANTVRIVYGGSVHPENAKEFIESGASGLLVGRDSLDPVKFGKIVENSK